MPAINPNDLAAYIRHHRLVPRGELVREFGVSPSTLYRHLVALERQGRIVRVGEGRASRYGTRGPLLGREMQSEVELYQVTASGRIQTIGRLLGLSDGRVLLAPQADNIPSPIWMLGDGGDGHFDDLPFFLIDQRPQGFLGRQIAHALSAYPDDPRRWTTGQVLEYMLRESADLPGNLLVGPAAVETFERWSPQRLSPKAYAAEAESILAGKVPGSSAGGEQPKFLAEVDGRQVLVKFSPAGSDPAAERWRDLLVAEHLALVTLASGGIDTAESRITESGGRIFLETVRFDRMGNRGRLPAISLEALDAEYSGRGTGWIDALSDLHHRHLVPTAALEVGRLLDTFGALIENNDRHLGNLALQPDVAGAFTLAPAYDMLPMRHAPVRSEVLPTPVFHSPVQKVTDATWQQAIDGACEFWQRVAADSRVSTGFQEIATERARIVQCSPPSSRPPYRAQQGMMQEA